MYNEASKNELLANFVMRSKISVDPRIKIEKINKWHSRYIIVIDSIWNSRGVLAESSGSSSRRQRYRSDGRLLGIEERVDCLDTRGKEKAKPRRQELTECFLRDSPPSRALGCSKSRSRLRRTLALSHRLPVSMRKTNQPFFGAKKIIIVECSSR